MKKEIKKLDLNQGSPDHQTDAPENIATGDLHSPMQYLIN